MSELMSREERLKKIQERREGKSNEKRGDAVDLVIEQMKRQEKINDYAQFSDYPETLLTTLRTFVKVFHIPESVVPYARNKKRFALWVKELTEIDTMCGSKIKPALEIASESLMKLPQWHLFLTRPKGEYNKIYTLLQTALIKIKADEEEEKKYTPKKKKDEKYITEIDFD